MRGYEVHDSIINPHVSNVLGYTTGSATSYSSDSRHAGQTQAAVGAGANGLDLPVTPVK